MALSLWQEPSLRSVGEEPDVILWRANKRNQIWGWGVWDLIVGTDELLKVRGTGRNKVRKVKCPEGSFESPEASEGAKLHIGIRKADTKFESTGSRVWETERRFPTRRIVLTVEIEDQKSAEILNVEKDSEREQGF